MEVTMDNVKNSPHILLFGSKRKLVGIYRGAILPYLDLDISRHLTRKGAAWVCWESLEEAEWCPAGVHMRLNEKQFYFKGHRKLRDSSNHIAGHIRGLKKHVLRYEPGQDLCRGEA